MQENIGLPGFTPRNNSSDSFFFELKVVDGLLQEVMIWMKSLRYRKTDDSNQNNHA